MILPWVGGGPAILGPFVALERRGGSEDPWLCVSSLDWICLYPIQILAQRTMLSILGFT